MKKDISLIPTLNLLTAIEELVVSTSEDELRELEEVSDYWRSHLKRSYRIGCVVNVIFQNYAIYRCYLCISERRQVVLSNILQLQVYGYNLL
jgi:hypothetical protein